MSSSVAGAWTPAVFLDRAEELRRRLLAWPIHNPCEPVLCVPFLQAEEWCRMTFRDSIMANRHGPRPGPNIQVFLDQASDGFAALENPPDLLDKCLTRWLLRDYVEHLPDAGETAAAAYLRLKVDRILDNVAYCRRAGGEVEQSWVDQRNQANSDGPYSLIGCEPVDPSYLNELVLAAKWLGGARLEPDYVFRQQGEQWDVRFDGESASLGDRTGMAVIRRILAWGPRQTSEEALTLENPAADPRAAQRGIDQIDVETIDDLIATLQAKLAECETAAEEAGIEEQIEQLQAQRKRGTDIHGKARLTGDERKRAADRIHKAITREGGLLDRLSNNGCPKLADYLRGIGKRGTEIVFEPRTRYDWVL